METHNQNTLKQLVILALGVFVAVKLWQASRQMFWTAFGLGWVVFWSAGGHFF
jgi:hypothetical protein